MAAGQKVHGIHVGHAASGGNVHITADQDGANCRAGLERLRLLGVADRTDTHHWHDAGRGELRRELFERGFRKSIKDQGRFNWLQIVRIIGRRHTAGR